MTHEYGIVTDTEPDILHRGPMSKDEALEWMLAMEERHRSMFLVVRRAVEPWEDVELSDLG